MPAIRVEDLWKQYRYGQIGYGTLRKDLESWWARRRGLADPNSRVTQAQPATVTSGEGDRFWALEGVNLEVEAGDVVGIVGLNGAGKSTFLKIMSRVTTPTRGRIVLKGRLASLLEVGTGFHPELTGRENVFLNGAILGMNRAEVSRKFDTIVGFAGLERFIDTPVKRYSSGMYVRLAFAVAAHLEPEILVVDEVLAVGDADFQKRCLGKLEDVSHEGRTVVFVSHNMAALERLCRIGVWLDRGRMRAVGPAADVVDSYLRSIDEKAAEPLRGRTDRGGSGESRIVCMNASPVGLGGSATVSTGRPCEITIGWEGCVPLRRPRFLVTFYSGNGAPLAHLDSDVTGFAEHDLPPVGSVSCRISRLPFGEGRYRLNAALLDGDETFDHVVGACTLDVEGGDYFGTGRTTTGHRDVCLVDHHWGTSSSPAEVEQGATGTARKR